MLPRALLFSSDEQTSTALRGVLTSLDIELVHCREIFAAIEELTSRSYQAILIDWVQELEASFLLNMARDLKSTRGTYSLVIVDERLAAVLTINPDAFLEKPFTAEQAREAILRAPALSQLAAVREQFAPEKQGGDVQRTNSVPPEPGYSPSLSMSERLSEEGGALGTREASLRRILEREMPHAKKHAFVLHESSVTKKAAALVCLLTLLVAVVRGEEQLGYWPKGLLSYERVTGLFLSPKEAGSVDPGNVALTDEQPSTARLNIRDREARAGSLFVDSSRRIEVRPVFGEAYVRNARPSSPLPGSLETNSAADETALSSSSPLIPSSLYLSPQWLSGMQKTAHPVIMPTNWSAGVVAVPEETSRSLLIHQVSPNYPLEALRAGLQGPVVFQALVGRDGTIEDLKLVRGYFALGLAAVNAVKQWRFRPYRVNGEIVRMDTFLTVSFPPANEPGKAPSNESLITYGAWR
jgi:TonB family protein